MEKEETTIEKEKELIEQGKLNGSVPKDFVPPGSTQEQEVAQNEEEEVEPKEETEDEEGKEEGAEKPVSENETSEEVVVNPFLSSMSEDKNEEQTDYRALYEQEKKDNDVLRGFLNEEETQFLLSAKDKGKSLFELLREAAPLDVERMSKSELIERRLASIKEKFKYSEEKIQEKRQSYNDLEGPEFEEQFFYFKKELADSQNSSVSDINFDFEKKVLTQREIRNRQTELRENSAKELDDIVNTLVKGNSISSDKKSGFYKEVDTVPELFQITDDGLVVPNVKIIAEIAYWRSQGSSNVEKAKNEAAKKASEEEKNKRRNTNANNGTPIVPSTPPKIDQEALEKEAGTALHVKR